MASLSASFSRRAVLLVVVGCTGCAGEIRTKTPQTGHWRINEDFPGLQRVLEDPAIYYVPGLLTDEECDALARKATPERLSWGGDGTGIATRRTSNECRLGYDEVAGLQRRFSELLAMPTSHLEPLKLTRYGPGDYFKFHHDAERDGYPEGCADCPTPRCNRVVTLILYLNDAGLVGGATVFPNLPETTLSVPPRKGSCLVHFPSFAGDAPERDFGKHDPRVGHLGAPVEAGEKLICQQWGWTGPLLRDKLADGYAPDGWDWAGDPPL